MSYTGFYRAFEERYYAPVGIIKDLRKQYLPFVEPLLDVYPSGEVFDIGCGRGEWLELMLELGMQPFGLDLDEGMLEECRQKGLPARQGDAVALMGTLPSESRVVISAFHVVEHIAFDRLQMLVSESLRVLKPGGLLIMETPNPENIIVATRNFYLDPTHQRPLPPQLLSFLPEYCGFSRTKIIRLQESKELVAKVSPSLIDVFAGASPDYAVIAQKSGRAEILERLDQVFSVEYGLEFNALARRYDQNVEGRLTSLERRLANTEAQAEMLAGKLRENLIDAVSQAERSAARARELESERAALTQSWSWRIMGPVRWAGGSLITGTGQLQRAATSSARSVTTSLSRTLALLMRPILRRPELSYRINQRLMRYPALHRQLLGIARRNAVFPDAAGYRTEAAQQSVAPPPPDLADLTPHARRIYADLKAAIEERRERR